MELKSRQAQLLKALSKSIGGGLPLKDVMGEFGISRRTVYYDISAINTWLAASELGCLSVEGQRIKVDSVQWDRLGNLNKASARRSLNAEERQSLTFLHIALSCEPTTIASLMKSFEVSRNTVLTDIHQLRDKKMGACVIVLTTRVTISDMP